MRADATHRAGERFHRFKRDASLGRALHDEVFTLLQPADQRGLNRIGGALHHALRDEVRRRNPSIDRAEGRLRNRAGALLEQRLPQVLRGNADLDAEGEDFLFAQPFADVLRRRLELGGALQYAVKGSLGRSDQPCSFAPQSGQCFHLRSAAAPHAPQVGWR